MRVLLLLSVLVILVAYNGVVEGNPLFKVFCNGVPLYRGRADSIVSPGKVSGHVHKVVGASNFGIGNATQSPLELYQQMRKSPCTSCSIGKVDLSAYWHPDLYYQWPNKTLSLVPSGGLTVYYLFRNGYGNQTKPAWKAFPPGFRMVSGNPFRRTFNASKVADRAINFACLSEGGGPETNGLELVKTRFCKNGLRMQVHFPQCWDGVNVDSPSHTTHVSFPTDPDGGNCPPTHPVRLPNLFFEAFYSVSDFPHGTGTQPFVLACGDSTGYGFHGDFLNGWDVNVLQAAILDSTCEQNNTADGNRVVSCKPLAQYVQNTTAGLCDLNTDINLNEHLGFGSGISALPGNNPITGGPTDTTPPAFGAPADTYKAPATSRFHLFSVYTSKYVSARGISKNPLVANSTLTTYHEVFSVISYGQYVALLNEYLMKVVTAGGTGSRLIPDRDQVSDWELFQLVAQPTNRYAIISKRNGNYLTVQADNTLAPTSTTIGTAQLFELRQPDGGSA